MPAATAIRSEAAIDPSLQRLKDMDRDSAVALGTLLILTVMACGYYIHSHLRAKRELDIERQQDAERRESWRRGSWSDERVSSRGSVMKMKALGYRVDSINSTGSHMPLTLPMTPQKQRREIVLSSSFPFFHRRTKSSEMPGYIFTPRSHQPPNNQATSRSPSPLSHPQPPSHDPKPRHYSADHGYPRRPSTSHPFTSSSSTLHNPPPLTQNQVDRAFWREVARHGSTTAASARLSTLETIPEPEIAHYAPARVGSRGRAGSRAIVVDRRRSEGAGRYDWTRPEEGAGVEYRASGGISGFGSVGWDKGSERDSRGEECDPRVCEAGGEESEGVQRTDWADKTEDVEK